MSAHDAGRSGSRPRGVSSSRAASPEVLQASSSAAGPSSSNSSVRKEPSLGVHAPGVNASSRRARSIHINIKPDPTPSSGLGIPLPSWLSGSSNSSKAGSSTGAGQVPHRDFGMAPHRRASESHTTHARSLSAINARHSISSAGMYPSGSAGGQSRSARWAATVKNQLRHIERDGLRRTFWAGSTRPLGNAPQGSQSNFGKTWDRIRRIPELLLVEYEDPVDAQSSWYNGGNEHESSDTSDLLDDAGPAGPNPRHASRRQHRRRQSHLRRINRLINRTRRTLGISRAALFLLLALLFLGVYESTKRGSGLPNHHSSAHIPLSLNIDTDDPFRTLLQAGIDVRKPAIPMSAVASQAVGVPQTPNTAAEVRPRGRAKVAAILLNWKRLDNLAVILAHLCSLSDTVFDTIHVWNNNPDTFLTQQVRFYNVIFDDLCPAYIVQQSFASSQCPKGRLRIHNSQGNLLFMSRYIACALADTPYCYFQDDDWLVPSLAAGYSHFMRNPIGPPVLLTGDEYPVKEGWEWCFFNTDFDLHSCFGWLGTGAFVSRNRALKTLDRVTLTSPSLEAGSRLVLGALGGDEMAMLDNAFTTFQNEPPYVLAGNLLPMPQPVAFTAGDGAAGDRRNEVFIQKGLDRLSESLNVLPNLSPYPPPLESWIVDDNGFRQPMNPFRQAAIPRPHPYWHHSRAIAQENDKIFMTNVASLPPPDAVIYQPHAQRNLSRWEHELGDAPELWAEGKAWALAWGYFDAVDGDYRTAWRSPNVIRKGDYIGLDLLTQIPVEQKRAITVHVMLEHADAVLPHLRMEVSIDGYTWRELAPKPSFSCHTTGHLSTIPSPSFPSTFLTSPEVRAALNDHRVAQSKKTSWSTPRSRLASCEVALSTSSGGARRKGWRFVRLVSEADMSLGWGVYELWVS